MFLSVEQHLGYYHQSGLVLQKWVIWCNVSNCAKGFRCRQLWIKISFTFFIRINILTFSLFSTSLSLSFSFFWQANCMPLLFISLHFRGTNCSPLSLGSGQEFIFSGSNVSECHFWQEPTSTMNTREDTACWVFFFFFLDHCIHLQHGNHVLHKAQAQIVYVEINIELKHSPLMNKKNE